MSKRGVHLNVNESSYDQKTAETLTTNSSAYFFY